jgi:integrase
MLRYYVPNSGSKYLVKSFVTKDYFEFKELAKDFIDSFQGVEFQEIESPNLKKEGNDSIQLSNENYKASIAKNVEPILDLSFKSLFIRYVDFLNGVNVPSHKHKPKDIKTIKGYITSIKLFKTALKVSEIEVGSMLITEIGDVEVGYFHDYLTKTMKDDGSPKFSPRTYNNKVADNRAFFNFIKDKLGVNITNPFDDVRKKFIKRKNFTIELTEFDQLLKVVTKNNGEYEINDRNKTYKRNHYRKWLKDAYQLALYTGERRDGIVLMKWSFIDMEERIITLPNYKVNRIQDIDKDRLIPITLDLFELLNNMGYKRLKGSEEYVICPQHENRTTIREWISKSFSHYWLLNKFNPEISFRHLRKTYVTLIYSQFGDKTKAVTDQNVDTILEYYLNKKTIVSQAKNLSLYDLEARINVA